MIFWFRRDLRLCDNRGLARALMEGHKVYPLFIFDLSILEKLKDKNDQRVTLIWLAVTELQLKLRKRGSDLIILLGRPEELIVSVMKQLKVKTVICNRDYEPKAIERDHLVKEKILKEGGQFYSYKDQVIFEADQILKSDGGAYQVFTAFKNKWYETLENKLEEIGEEKIGWENLASFSSENIFKKSIKELSEIGFSPYQYEKKSLFNLSDFGEDKGRKQFKAFLNKIDEYDKNRNFPEIRGTSELSIHFRFGTISIREVLRALWPSFEKSKGKKSWLDEIVWREFYQMILFKHPDVVKEPFLKKYKKIKFPYNETLFKAWCEGKTGFPIIDASMRCFNQTGFIHNRLRMVVASFLIKTLLIDYRKGEDYFADKLIDFDLAANNGGWQWCASTGCDASPYFRIFNPLNQSLKFDPKADFILRFCPELQKLSLPKIHAPWTASEEEQYRAGVILGKNYPLPVVDYSLNRKKALEIYQSALM